MADNKNPAHIYRQIAKKIVTKLKDNLAKTIDKGSTPDLYFSLEHSIIEALRYADQQGELRSREYYIKLMQEFDGEDGTPTS